MTLESDKLGNSNAEQRLLRPIAIWAAQCSERALSIFEHNYPANTIPRQAVEAGREYGMGKSRNNNLRAIAMAAFKLGKDVDQASKYVTKSAQLTAAVAYTHTDLQLGVQGIRQARHILGPAVYAAMALETNSGEGSRIGDASIQFAIDTAPNEVNLLLKSMPPQLKGASRADELFEKLDTALRSR